MNDELDFLEQFEDELGRLLVKLTNAPINDLAKEDLKYGTGKLCNITRDILDSYYQQASRVARGRGRDL